MCNVIHIRDKKNTADEVYIGRGSKWGNPFKIGKDGNRDDVIDKYYNYITNKPELMNSLYELTGKTLVCFCKPKACHGDILANLEKEYYK